MFKTNRNFLIVTVVILLILVIYWKYQCKEKPTQEKQEKPDNSKRAKRLFENLHEIMSNNSNLEEFKKNSGSDNELLFVELKQLYNEKKTPITELDYEKILDKMNN